MTTSTKARVAVLEEYWCVKGDSQRFETTHNGEIEARARELYPTDDALRAAILATGRCSEWLLDKGRVRFLCWSDTIVARVARLLFLGSAQSAASDSLVLEHPSKLDLRRVCHRWGDYAAIQA